MQVIHTHTHTYIIKSAENKEYLDPEDDMKTILVNMHVLWYTKSSRSSNTLITLEELNITQQTEEKQRCHTELKYQYYLVQLM